MDIEFINKVEVLETGELLLGFESQGKSMYQFAYREAAGVYWDESRNGFKSTEMKEWACHEWFRHMVKIVRSGLVSN